MDILIICHKQTMQYFCSISERFVHTAALLDTVHWLIVFSLSGNNYVDDCAKTGHNSLFTTAFYEPYNQPQCTPKC